MSLLRTAFAGGRRASRLPKTAVDTDRAAAFDNRMAGTPRSCIAQFLTCAVLAAVVGLPLAAQAAQTTAVSDSRFLDSIGVNSSINSRGEDLAHTAGCIQYLGVRWIRSGPSAGQPGDIADLIKLHKETGVKYSWSNSDIALGISTARQLAQAGALLAFEGPNEPNNWPITYQGEKGGGSVSWMPLAEFERDYYKAVKSDPVLKKYPVWSTTETGAETDNVGLQFLTIPAGAGCLLPAGTRFADYATCHNYYYHPHSPGPMDNKTWMASDPSPACNVDGLYGNFGSTWAKHYQGYTDEQLQNLPRVTTETGTTIDGPITEHMQALNQLSMYLDQFKRGWSYSAVYIMRDRVDEAGNQTFGFYRPDYTPRQSGVYLHNLTTILADDGTLKKPGHLDYSIPGEPATTHDMLLEKSDGTFELVVWSELLQGSSQVTVDFASPQHTVTVYDPTVGTTPVEMRSDAHSVDLTLSDHPLILEMRQ